MIRTKVKSNLGLFVLENCNSMASHQMLEKSSCDLYPSLKSFVFGEPTVTGSPLLDALELWLFPQLRKKVNQITSFGSKMVHRLTGTLRTRLVEHHRTQPMDFPQRDYGSVLPLPADVPDLRHRIEAAVARILLDTLNKVWDELAYRLDVYRVTNGAHTEHM
ncbi:uncharacterized protein TNCV_4708061 [Trichonephila clavipes]|nr:uncharacterized protein TNCV_4708061 [Trichonephila clavipes]